MSKYWLEFKAWDMGFDAHLTLHWLGDAQFPSSEDPIGAWLHKNIGQQYTSFVKPIAIDIFGPPEEPVPVVKVDVFQDLMQMKDELERLHPSPSEYEWTPHITLKGLGYNTIHIPDVIKIGPLDLKWT